MREKRGCQIPASNTVVVPVALQNVVHTIMASPSHHCLSLTHRPIVCWLLRGLQEHQPD
jgi:hypothetical protein